MVRRRLGGWLALPALVLLLSTSCGGEDGEQNAATAVIGTAAGPVELTVELAQTDAERQRGLMGRTSLDERSGMLFLFAEDRTGGFWMKDTLIPLSIAFVDGSGRILRILDMEPCRADPCPTYDPGVAYRRALEVNRGAFGRLGVEVGDTVLLEREQ
jgi:uncharacterized membrane protein (UPF0127 family)